MSCHGLLKKAVVGTCGPPYTGRLVAAGCLAWANSWARLAHGGWLTVRGLCSV